MSGAVNAAPPLNVLRNLGVPVRVYVLASLEDGRLVEPYTRTYVDDQGTAAEEWRYIKVTNRVLADIESPEPFGWGSMDAWEADIASRPSLAIARTLALVWQLHTNVAGQLVPDTTRAAEMLVDGASDEYGVAIGSAYMLAQGFSVEAAGEQLRVSIASLIEARTVKDRLMVESIIVEMERTLKKLREDADSALKSTQPSPDDEHTQTSPAPTPEPGSSSSWVDGYEPVEASASSGT